MDAYIIDAIRTPRARGNDKSALKSLNSIQLSTRLFDAIANRNDLKTEVVMDAILGCATQYGDQGSNMARMVLLAANWSDSVAALTINRACASGLSAVTLAALQAANGDSVAIGGGVEMMSRVPMGADHGSLFEDHAFSQQHALFPLGISADAIATQYNFSREACDQYAATSHQRAAHARAEGWLTSIIAIHAEDGQVLLTQDECIRPLTTVEQLSTLPPAFADLGARGFDVAISARLGLGQITHVHHVGNSPIPGDGASLVLVASKNAMRRNRWSARARILATADGGINRSLALTGAVEVTRKVLAKAKLSADQIDLFEINEAFAAVMLQYIQELSIHYERVNVNGGTLAFGHAMGSTGAALIGMALDELERRSGRYAVIAVSGAAGLASAMLIERLS